MVHYHDSAHDLKQNANKEDAVSLLKLHGSLNWALAPYIEPTNTPIRIYRDFRDVPIRSYQPNVAQELLLAPPVWDKGTAKIGHPLSGVWSHAIKKLEIATRIFVIGYSLPLVDSHFRYLFAAGLQHNISLREVIFVDPAFDETNPNKDALESRVFSILWTDMQKSGMLKLLPFTARQFFLHKDSASILNRKYPVV